MPIVRFNFMRRKNALLAGLMLLFAAVLPAVWYPTVAQEERLSEVAQEVEALPAPLLESLVGLLLSLVDGIVGLVVEGVLMVIGPFIAFIPEFLTISEILHAIANPVHTLMKLLEIPVIGPFLEDEIFGTFEEILAIISIIGYVEVIPLIMDLILGVISDIPNAVANPFQTLKSVVTMIPPILSQYSFLGTILVCLEALPCGFFVVWLRALWHFGKVCPVCGWPIRIAQCGRYILGPLF